MIKLFASDLDGTLLNATHMVDPVIVSALRTVTKAARISPSPPAAPCAAQ